MTEPVTMTRSPELMSRGDTALVVIDVQEKLMPLVRQQALVTWNIGRLIDGAKLLCVPVIASEQYPKGLGPTVEPLRAKLGQVPEKHAFSCAAINRLFEPLAERGIY